MFVAETKIRVRYAETDKMGYCYYGNYPAYFEQARSDAFRNSGCSYKSIEDAGFMMPVISMHIEYKKPAFYDDLLTIRVTVKKKPSIKMEFFFETFNEKGDLLNYGSTMLCFVNSKTGRPSLPPQNLISALDKYFTESE